MGVSFFQATIDEMHRRRVFRVAGAYAIVAFILLQLGEITFGPLQLPQWSLTALILVLVLGFPLVMALAWIFDWTATGIERTEANENSSHLRAGLLLAGVLGLDLLFGYYLYSVYAPSIRAEPLTASEPQTSRSVANSIAVLPFADMSAAQDQAYFVDGITEELINVLARIDGLQVTARTSSFAFRGQNRDVREIGSELDVATVLEGSVRRQGDTIRVTAQLIDARSGLHLWSNTYDRDVVDVLAIQDDIARSISEELLQVGYEGFALVERGPAPPASFAAYDRYLEGRALWRQRTPEALQRAVDVFQQTIELDPAFAPAYSGQADAWLLLAAYGNLSLAEAVRQAEPLIRTALELDGQLAEGFASLGLLYWNLGRLSAGEAHLRRAIDLDPDNLVAHSWLGGLLAQKGELGEQQDVYRQALAKDPMNLLLNLNLASNLLVRGELQEGFERLEQIRQVHPTSTLLLRTLAAWESRYDRFDDALAHASQALALAPDEPPNQALMVHLLLDIGALDRAQATLERALVVGRQNDGVRSSQARYLLISGRRDEMRRLMEAQLERSAGDLVANKSQIEAMYWLARLDMLEGHLAQAIDGLAYLAEAGEVLPPDMMVDVLTWKAAAHMRNGDPAGARLLLDQADRQMTRLKLQGMAAPEALYLQAVIAALREQSALALDLLDQAIARGWGNAWETGHDLRLAGLRGDGRFQALLDELETRAGILVAGLDGKQVARLR